MAKVLLVDDDSLLLRVLARELTSTGHDVSTAEDGVAAKELSTKTKFDIIVSDVKMPRMSGIELLEYISLAAPETQFIILAGEGSMQEALEAFRTGRVFDCLVKPLANIHRISVVIDRALHHRAMVAENSRFAQERQELALIVENSADLITLTLLSGDIAYINSAGRTLIGIDEPEDCLAINLVDCIAAESRLDVEEVLANLQRKGHWQGECYFKHRVSGENILCNLNAFTVHDSSEEHHFAIAFVARDVRRFKFLEQQLAQAQRLESIGQLAAGIAHEINTPVQYIGDNTKFISDAFADLESIFELCRKIAMAADDETRISVAREISERVAAIDLDYMAEEIPAAIAQSLEGVQRVSHIVSAMREFSHPGSEERVMVDLNQCLESTITVARNEWKYVAEIETRFDSNLPNVSCYAGELNQVFLNLLVNASHAITDVVGDGSREKGLITIATTRTEEGVEVRISDTGTGIPQSIRAKVFDHFFTTKSVGKGTGQGLAICHSVVQKHDGTIRFESDLGVGTTFIVNLPVANDCDLDGESLLDIAA